MAVVLHALTWRSKGQSSRSRGYDHGRMSVSGCCGHCGTAASMVWW